MQTISSIVLRTDTNLYFTYFAPFEPSIVVLEFARAKQGFCTRMFFHANGVRADGRGGGALGGICIAAEDF